MKIYLAGISTATELFYEHKGGPYLLMSFLEGKKLNLTRLDTKQLLLDSGAFTYLNTKKNAKLDWDKYIIEYAEFINKHNIDLFFELDIDPIVGLKEVERLRAKLEKITNKQCIPVWHKSRGLEYWKKMCKEYNYIAIGGIVTKEIKQTQYKIFAPLLKIAKENKCKVHALGFTRSRELHKYKFYSVDSTNWITTRFNNYYIFNGKMGIMEAKRKNIGDSRLRVKKEKIDEYNLMQINEWVKFQKYAELNL